MRNVSRHGKNKHLHRIGNAYHYPPIHPRRHPYLASLTAFAATTLNIGGIL